MHAGTCKHWLWKLITSWCIEMQGKELPWRTQRTTSSRYFSFWFWLRSWLQLVHPRAPLLATRLLSATVRDFINFTGHAKLKRKIGHAAKANKSWIVKRQKTNEKFCGKLSQKAFEITQKKCDRHRPDWVTGKTQVCGPTSGWSNRKYYTTPIVWQHLHTMASDNRMPVNGIVKSQPNLLMSLWKLNNKF